MTEQENPLKIYRPIPPPPSAGEKVAFELTVLVDVDEMTMRIGWDVGDKETQAAFFEQHPLTAAMLLALARGPVAPPAKISAPQRLGNPEE